MLATVNSRRRSVSRGPDDQAQGVVAGWGGAEMEKRRVCVCKRKIKMLLGDSYDSIQLFSPSFRCVLVLPRARVTFQTVSTVRQLEINR